MTKRILIADTDILFKEYARKMLEGHGIETDWCETAKEAEAICLREKPDLVIIDLLKNNDDTGFVLCYRLKNKFPDLPIIILSAVSATCMVTFNFESDESKSWIKADAFIEKDGAAELLLKEVLKLLKI